MKKRSMFWPFFLIGSGIVWFLIELRTIPLDNLWSLVYIWPFLLMAAGVSLILRAHWAFTKFLVSALTVLGMVLAVIFAPQLGWNRAPSWAFFHLGDFGNFNGSIAGSGNVVTENRTLADFQSVTINFPVDLTIQQGETYSATIEAEDNLLPQLATRISNGTLYIENNQSDWLQRVNPTRPVKINLTTKTLARLDFPSAGSLTVMNFETNQLDLSISGAGSVHLTNLATNSLSVKLSGAGTITADGVAHNLEVDISGFGGFQGADLTAETADISISGAGNATVWVTTKLNVQISGTGSVNYYGSPSMTRNVSGIGHISGLGTK